ncbi:hypothetical protein Tco_1451525 [Tanacetum coccineum]
MNGNVSEPSEALLDGGLGSSQYGYYVGADNVRAGNVVLDFGNSKIRFASPKMLSNSCLSESNSGGGQMILDFENSVIRSTGDATKLFGVDNSNYRSRDGCESSSRCFVGAQRDASIASPFQTNYRHARLSRGESNAETDIGLCDAKGKVVSQWPRDPPNEVKELFRDKGFQENIRAYNQMFAMTSFGACIDDSVNKRRGPYVFKISGQIYHWIGSLCPEPGNPPHNSSQLDPEIVSSFISVLDEHNELVRLFRTARDRIEASAIPDF